MNKYRPNNARMWTAYMVSAPAAPIICVVFCLLYALVATAVGFEVNHAAMIVVPAVVLGIGLPAAFLVAGTIGMSIAFALRDIGKLNLLTIQLSTLIWCLAFAAFCSVILVSSNQSPGILAAVFLYVLLLTGVPTLFSGVMFWLITCKLGQQATSRSA